MPMDWEKWQQKKDSQMAPPDLEKVVENFKRFRGRMPSGVILVVVAVIVYLLSGIYIVAPDEVGVVKRFGAYSRTTSSGPHYHLPYPVETVLKPKVTQVRRIEVGFRMVSPGPPATYRPVTDESLMLTGDENIIDIWFIVQYRIKDAMNFLFNVENPQNTVNDAAEAAMREVIGENKIDEALTAGKFKIQQDAAQVLQHILDSYQAGLEIVSIQLAEVHPPMEVRSAFKDVASAREDQNRFINEAQGYANDILPKAKGRAAELIAQAEGYRAEKVEKAKGDASRFLAMLEEYRKAKDITRKRLYLETMEDILPKAQKYLMDPESQGVLPLLQLKEPAKTPPPPDPRKETGGGAS
jgi:modulator of FtsH protease HflK